MTARPLAVTMAAADARVPVDGRPRALGNLRGSLSALGALPRMMSRLGARIAEGLPDDVLWLSQIARVSNKYRLARSEILELRSIGYTSIERLMLGSAEADAARCHAFAKAKPVPQTKSSWLRDACRDLKTALRRQACDRQVKKAARCPQAELIPRIYAATGKDFEQAFEDALTVVGVMFEKLDASARTGAPDYLIMLTGCPPLVVELKSRTAGNLVSYNLAVEVLAASEVHGFRDAFCVTVCHPGVDPAVAPVIASSERLCVVESADLVDALLRLCQGHLTQAELWQWLASPGQALASDLFYSSRRALRPAVG